MTMHFVFQLTYVSVKPNIYRSPNLIIPISLCNFPGINYYTINKSYIVCVVLTYLIIIAARMLCVVCLLLVTVFLGTNGLFFFSSMQ